MTNMPLSSFVCKLLNNTFQRLQSFTASAQVVQPTLTKEDSERWFASAGQNQNDNIQERSLQMDIQSEENITENQTRLIIHDHKYIIRKWQWATVWNWVSLNQI